MPAGKKRSRKRSVKQELAAIERAAKREAQKAAGALDGRFRTRKVDNKKRYDRSRGRSLPPEADL